MNEKIEQLKRWIEESDKIVFFGGAGVSTEASSLDAECSVGVSS